MSNVNEIQTTENIPDVGKVIINNTSLDLETSIDFINLKLRAVARNFITVGIALQEIEKVKLYKSKGFKNIHEFAKQEFQLSKNQTYNLLSVANRFSLPSGSLSDQYKDFSFSQLVEMVSLPDARISQISSSSTVKEIREVKKKVKKEILQDQFKKQTPIVPNDAKHDNNKIFQAIKDKANYYREGKRFNWAKELEELVLYIKNEFDID